MTYDIIEGIRLLLLCILITQFAYSLSVFLLERAMINFYTIGTYEEPSTLFQKSINFIMFILTGIGYNIYLKISKYNWVVRKLLFLIALISQGIASIIIYLIIYGTLKAIFL